MLAALDAVNRELGVLSPNALLVCVPSLLGFLLPLDHMVLNIPESILLGRTVRVVGAKGGELGGTSSGPSRGRLELLEADCCCFPKLGEEPSWRSFCCRFCLGGCRSPCQTSWHHRAGDRCRLAVACDFGMWGPHASQRTHPLPLIVASST